MIRPHLSGPAGTCLRFGAAIALFVALCQNANASGSSGTVQVLARILEPIQIQAARAMDFGRLLADSSPTSETIYRLSPDGTLSVEGETGSAHAGGQEAGRFTFSGVEGQSYSYEASITRDFSDSGLTLVAVHAGSVGQQRGSGTFTSGQTELALGGDLMVAGRPASGKYSDAEITLTIAYN